jgi:RNA polymerase sigma-70 factor, ECF subfamily
MPSDLDARRERRLVARARRDPDAFRRLYRHYFPRVYAYISYRVGCVQDVEDLTAETFLRAVEGLSGFEWRGEGAFAAWLFRIAHNVVSNFYRDGGKAPDAIPQEDLLRIAGSEELPTEALARQELTTHLRRLIGTLSPRQQEIVTLRFFGGLRNQEIAALLELDERTVAAHLCRGVRTLQARFEEMTVEERAGTSLALEVSRG